MVDRLTRRRFLGTATRTALVSTLFPIIERDHLVWTLPAGMDTIRGQPTLEARVQGSATYTRIGPTSRQRVDDLAESGDGSLVIQMTQW